MTIKFVKFNYRNGKELKREVLFVWSFITKGQRPIIIQNFYDGFCAAFPRDFRRPSLPQADGYEIWSYNFHKDHSGFVYKFLDGNNRLIRLIHKKA